MSKLIAYVIPGTDRVAIVSPNMALKGSDEPLFEFLQRIIDAVVPKNASEVRVVDANAVPSDRTFRGSWRLTNNGTISVDMQSAKETKLALIRDERDKLLMKLDSEWIRAVELGDVLSEKSVADRKQRLRDLPETIKNTLDSIDTPELLKRYRPPELG